MKQGLPIFERPITTKHYRSYSDGVNVFHTSEVRRTVMLMFPKAKSSK